MATTFTYTAFTTVTDVFTTNPSDLEGIASAGLSIASDTIGNGTNRHLLMDVQMLYNGEVTNPTITDIGPNIVLHIARSIDGTNFEAPVSAPPGGAMAFPRAISTNATDANTLVFPEIPIPPGSFKIWVENRTGAGFPTAAGSVSDASLLEFVTYSHEGV